MILFHALSLLGVLIASCLEVEREKRESRRRLLGRARARALDEGNRCPYCHDGFEPPENEDAEGEGEEEPQPRIRCTDCGTRHHLPCWQEHGACSVYGCGRVSDPGADAPNPSPAPEPEGAVEHETVGSDRSALDPRG